MVHVVDALVDELKIIEVIELFGGIGVAAHLHLLHDVNVLFLS